MGSFNITYQFIYGGNVYNMLSITLMDKRAGLSVPSPGVTEHWYSSQHLDPWGDREENDIGKAYISLTNHGSQGGVHCITDQVEQKDPYGNLEDSVEISVTKCAYIPACFYRNPEWEKGTVLIHLWLYSEQDTACIFHGIPLASGQQFCRQWWGIVQKEAEKVWQASLLLPMIPGQINSLCFI